MAEEQEPSIEEILASIRQIISDDDERVPPVEPEPEEEPEEDVLELTQKLVKPAPEREPEPDFEPIKVDLKDFDEPEEEPEPEESYSEDEDMAVHNDDAGDVDPDSVFTQSAEHAALKGFTKLASRAALDRRGTGDTTIEDVVRELMKPMLREWLDAHLPSLIEKVVQKELREIARRAADEE